jgi:tetratricopeptide (TPR) repeat protein
LENSEKSLTFAGQLFLVNLQQDPVERRRVWKALQAKDLFERSLKINPANDSSKVGLGACFMFGGISATPMEGIMKVREVAEKDSGNLYAQLTLVKGTMLSGQYDKGISRLLTVIKMHPDNLEAMLMLADLYERTGEKKLAADWYRKCLPLGNPDLKNALEQRLKDLGK